MRSIIKQTLAFKSLQKKKKNSPPLLIGPIVQDFKTRVNFLKYTDLVSENKCSTGLLLKC